MSHYTDGEKKKVITFSQLSCFLSSSFNFWDYIHKGFFPDPFISLAKRLTKEKYAGIAFYLVFVPLPF